MSMNERTERASSSARSAGSFLAAPPAVTDDAHVASRVADAPSWMGGTEVPYASSEKWSTYCRRVLDRNAPVSSRVQVKSREACDDATARDGELDGLRRYRRSQCSICSLGARSANNRAV
jgi:hypothetical protein